MRDFVSWRQTKNGGFALVMAFSILNWFNNTAGTTKLSKKSETAVQFDHVLIFIHDKDCTWYSQSFHEGLDNAVEVPSPHMCIRRGIPN